MKKFLSLIIILMSTLILQAAGETTIAAPPESGEVVKENCLSDGVTIAVHYRLTDLSPYHRDPDKYVQTILQDAQDAYNEIVHRQGFNSPGFTFSNPDRDYCYDSDKTIDIYVSEANKAPCYDIIKREGKDYDAIILFPADYRGYMERWGARDTSEDRIALAIRGSLFHEMFHLISYSYNKNIAAWYIREKGASRASGGDWYVEGLARYFETLASSYDNFFSEGFIKKEGDKIKIFQEGANYLMKNPDESLKDARYDYSLFWAYIHKRYGMDKIEEISRRFRFIKEADMKDQTPAIISDVTGDDFKDVLQGFGIAMYFKYFNPEIKRGLYDVKHMTLEDFSSNIYKQMPSWSSNFIWVNLNDSHIPNVISLKKITDKGDLRMSVVARFENGKTALIQKVILDSTDLRCQMNLADLKRFGVEELMLIITNASPEHGISYGIQRS